MSSISPFATSVSRIACPLFERNLRIALSKKWHFWFSDGIFPAYPFIPFLFANVNLVRLLVEIFSKTLDASCVIVGFFYFFFIFILLFYFYFFGLLGSASNFTLVVCFLRICLFLLAAFWGFHFRLLLLLNPFSRLQPLSLCAALKRCVVCSLFVFFGFIFPFVSRCLLLRMFGFSCLHPDFLRLRSFRFQAISLRICLCLHLHFQSSFRVFC
jgi:hypothetical protein